MKILFCTKTTLSRELGGSKVLIELAEEMKLLGWKCNFVCPETLGLSLDNYGDERYPDALREFLLREAGNTDVVEYDHNYFPFPRKEFNPRTLFVARAVLLAHHFGRIEIPNGNGFKSKIRSLLTNKREKILRAKRIERAHKTVMQADLINVANNDDKVELVQRGVDARKIVVIPYGISRNLRKLFNMVSGAPPQDPRVAFIGTFDSRKGSVEFPMIVSSIQSSVPEVTFRLLGTGGEKENVLASFPKPLRKRIEVIPNFHADELPGLLENCSIGVFPSYIEGFGLGVLEMLASSIPVIAYNSPGPSFILSPQYLVPRGDIQTLCAKAIHLLTDVSSLKAARLWARDRSTTFSWESAARQTSQKYIDRWMKNATSSK